MNRPTPEDFNARPGDIGHVRSTSFYGGLIRDCFKKSWGNHDMTLVWLDEIDAKILKLPVGWCWAEALTRGFRLTPWDEYLKEVQDGSRLIIVRNPLCNDAQAQQVAWWAIEMAKRKSSYNFGGILRIWWNVITKANLGKAKLEWEWFCTQSVRQQHLWAGMGDRFDVWKKDEPTPYTTSKRILSKELTLLEAPGYDIGNASWISHWEQQATT
jgi:hypothetical protein